MANYYATCRSNYFKIGKPKEFLHWMESLPGLQWQEAESPEGSPHDMYGMLFVNDVDGGGWPTYRLVDLDEDGSFAYKEVEVDIYQELAEFLAPGEVAILEEVGSEKLRYLHASSVAVRWDGEIMSLSLTDMEKRVEEEWGIKPTSATY